jgi:hypothetical protein
MALDTDRDRTAAIEHGTHTPFWTDYMLPKIQDRCKSVLRGLALSRSDDEDIRRGWFQALEWVMNLPLQEVADYRKIEEERERDAKLADLDDHRARYGFRSPYTTQPAPGELTGEAQEE